MALLFNRLKAFCLTQGSPKNYWVAFSGGLDSHVLLHLFANLRQQLPIQLRAVHINHGWSSHADDWANHCLAVCTDLKVELIIKNIQAKPSSGDSPENIARQHRYEILAELLTPNDILLTAHHQDDQAETLLIQLLRGSGLKGLAAMPLLKPLGQGFHARPLLQVARAELERYAAAQHLQWIEDESNANVHFTRNFLRHDMLPLLKQRWPTVTKTLSRTAEHCAEAQALLEEWTAVDLAGCQTNKAQALSIKKLFSLSPARQRQILRAWLNTLHFPIPSAIKLHQIQRDFLYAKKDKSPYISWSGIELRRYRDYLYAMPCLLSHDPGKCFAWDLQQPLLLPGIGTLQAVFSGDKQSWVAGKKVTVRFRQGGEHCQLPQRNCHHSLKHLFQEWGVPPWERARVPLVYVEDQLMAVVGYFLAEVWEAHNIFLSYF